MDSHTFSEPRLLPASEEDDELSWLVDVVRLENNLVVGTLTINNKTFPPRKRKGKVVWRLPVSKTDKPRFGENEKTRLWDMFKQQKKERRKRAKQQQKEEENQQQQVAETTANQNGSADQTNVESSRQDASEKESLPKATHDDTAPTLTKTSSSSIIQNGGEHQGEHSNSRNQQLLPPPPPGFENSAALTSPSIRNGTRDTDDGRFETSPLYFQPSDISNLAAMVAQTFVQSMQKQAAELWLRYYNMERQQHSTLLMGQAKGVCTTHQERLRQWQSLMSEYWECHGLTQHAIPTVEPHEQFLVVLTGRTVVAPASCCSFTFSLVLQSTSSSSNGQYQIVNDVLSLMAH